MAEMVVPDSMDILIKTSNGASDFGNKFGQPLITGSILTFEHEEDAQKNLGFDEVIMQGAGIGYGKLEQTIKHHKQEIKSLSGWRKL
jgi:phosphoribosylformylglycinamidine synthase